MDITTDTDIGGNVSDTTNGYDIRFTSDDEVTLLKYEREYFNVTTGTATGHYWVKCAPLAASATDIYIYYNDGDGSVDGEDAANVWDANFKMVQHLEDVTTSTVSDSTGNSNDGAKKGANEPIETTGQVYKGQDFDGNNDYILIDDPAGGSLDFGTTDFTVSAWLKTSTNGDGMIFQKGAKNASVMCNCRLQDESRIVTKISDGTDTMEHANTQASYHDGSYHLITYVVDRDSATGGKHYFDGGVQATSGNPTAVDSIDNDADAWIGECSTLTYVLNGDMDELRVSTTLRSADWIKFEYHNMYEGDNELDWASEESTAVTFIPRVIMIT